MGNKLWVAIVGGVLVILVAGTVMLGKHMQSHPSEPTQADRVAACVDRASDRMADVDDINLYTSTLLKVQKACEKRYG